MPQIVNDQFVRLLYIIPVGNPNKYGNIIQLNNPNPIFFKLDGRHLQKLKFELRGRYGELCLFDNSSETVTIILIARPANKGVV